MRPQTRRDLSFFLACLILGAAIIGLTELVYEIRGDNTSSWSR